MIQKFCYNTPYSFGRTSNQNSNQQKIKNNDSTQRKTQLLKSPYSQQFLSKYSEYTKYIVPHCKYLIYHIGPIQQKNIDIINLVIAIFKTNPISCFWQYIFIANYSKHRSFDLFYQTIKKIQIKIMQLQLYNKDTLNFLQNFIRKIYHVFDRNKPQIPNLQQLKKFINVNIDNLPSMFDQKTKINSIKSIQKIGQGKSNPLKVQFQIKNSSKTLTVVIKQITGLNYRMQSQIANFFKDTGMIDKQCSYNISVITNQLLFLQYVPHYADIMQLSYKYAQEQKNKKKALTVDRSLTLYNFIFENSKNINHWWYKYINYIRSVAQWSYLGYVVGLGDRHNKNILIKENCKLIHIDFQYSFDIGFKLNCPEWVPFRMTPMYVIAFGILGCDGLFYTEMIHLAHEFLKNQSRIWKALSNFTSQKNINCTIQVMKKAKFQKLKIKTKAEGINYLIKNATNKQLLQNMFIGWGYNQNR